MRTRNAESGFSLIELVVSVGILMVVLSVAFTLASRSQSMSMGTQILAQAHENADFAMQRVTEIIRGSGSNPTNGTTINSLNFVQSGGSTSSITVKSDLNGDGDTLDYVTNVVGTTTSVGTTVGSADARYFIIASEDVTISFDAAGNTILMKDNTTAGSTPIILAQNVIGFSAVPTSDSREVNITVEAGPTLDIPRTDARYRSYTATGAIKLRNRQ